MSFPRHRGPLLFRDSALRLMCQRAVHHRHFWIHEVQRYVQYHLPLSIITNEWKTKDNSTKKAQRFIHGHYFEPGMQYWKWGDNHLHARNYWHSKHLVGDSCGLQKWLADTWLLPSHHVNLQDVYKQLVHIEFDYKVEVNGKNLTNFVKPKFLTFWRHKSSEFKCLLYSNSKFKAISNTEHSQQIYLHLSSLILKVWQMRSKNCKIFGGGKLIECGKDFKCFVQIYVTYQYTL